MLGGGGKYNVKQRDSKGYGKPPPGKECLLRKKKADS